MPVSTNSEHFSFGYMKYIPSRQFSIYIQYCSPKYMSWCLHPRQVIDTEMPVSILKVLN